MENVRFALRALSANKLRAFLTMLGIIIGVASVITLLSVGNGVSSFITGQFQGLGNNLLFVIPGELSGPNEVRRRPGGLGLDSRDVLAVQDPANVPSAKLVVPLMERPSFVAYRDEVGRTTITATTAEWAIIRSFAIVRGNFFSSADDASGARVAVLGQATYEKLFTDGRDPIGETIKIGDLPFTVIGLLEKKGASGFQDQNDIVVVPLNTARQRLFPSKRTDGALRIDYMLVEAIAEEAQNNAIAEIELTLRQTHNIAYNEVNDFSIISQADLVGAFEQVTGVITLFLAVIAGISLVVGGIGIMNIMLVSVRERTKEIGLRKAIGARRRDILGQFIVEAMLLSLLGGLIGLLIGALGTWAISSSSATLQAQLDWSAVVIAILFSALIGLLFGVYPATRAAALNPIEALRYE